MEVDTLAGRSLGPAPERGALEAGGRCPVEGGKPPCWFPVVRGLAAGPGTGKGCRGPSEKGAKPPDRPVLVREPRAATLGHLALEPCPGVPSWEAVDGSHGG